MENYSSASLTLTNPTSDRELHYILPPQKTTLLGRSPDCHIVLDPSEYPTVSRHHAEIKLVENNHQFLWQVIDKGTTNGTLINGKKIEIPHALQTGDCITLGFKGPEFLFVTEALEATVLMEIPEDKQVDLTAENKEETPSSEEVKEESTTEEEKPEATPTAKKEKPASEEKESQSSESTTEEEKPEATPTAKKEETTSEEVKEESTDKEEQPEATPTAKKEEPASEEVKEESTDKEEQPEATPTAKKEEATSEEKDKSDRQTKDTTKSRIRARSEKKERTDKKDDRENKAKSSVKTESKKTDTSSKEEQQDKPHVDLAQIAVPELTNIKDVWDVIQIKEVATLDIDSKNIQCLALNPQNQVLAIALQDKSIQLWDWQNKQQIVSIDKAHRMAINSLTFSHDSKTLISSGSDKTIKIWQIENQSEIASLSGHKQAVNTLKISNDGKTLASSGSDKTIKIWDIEQQTEIATFTGHKLAVNSVCFSQDNKYLLSGGGDKTIKVWNLETKEEEKTIKTESKSGIEYLSFSADGNSILSIFQDNHLSIIDRDREVAIFDFNLPEKTGELTITNEKGDLFVSTLAEGGVIIWHI